MDFKNITTQEFKDIIEGRNRQGLKELLNLIKKISKIKGISFKFSQEKIKDLTQDVTEKIILNYDKFNPNKGVLERWLKTITYNVCCKYLLKERKIEIIGCVADNDTGWYDYLDYLNMYYNGFDDIITEKQTKELQYLKQKELLKVLHKAIDKLAPSQKEVFKLYLINNLNHKEIAQVLGLTESTSKSQFSRAKQNVIIHANRILEKSSNKVF